jgi:hypothetical protein
MHRLPTTAGYSGQSNKPFDERTVESSPFAAFRLLDPNYLARPESVAIDLVQDVRFRDYAWLHLTANGVRYAVLHHRPEAVPEVKVELAALRAQLEPGTIFTDDQTAVFDRERLGPPARAVVVPTTGWGQRTPLRGLRTCAVRSEARLLAYNPRPDQLVRIAIEATAHRRPRTITLHASGQVVTTWHLEPGTSQQLVSPDLRFAGLKEFVLESDGDDRPHSNRARKLEIDPQPFSYRVSSLRVITR